MATSAPNPASKTSAKAGNLQAVPSPEEKPEEAPASKRSRKKIFVIGGLALLVLALGGGAAWYFMGGEKQAPAEGTAEGAADAATDPAKPPVVKYDPDKPPVFVNMEPFTVNLQSEGAEQFLQISFTLQVGDPAQVELIKLYMPQIRSRLLLLLSSKKASDISTVEGKKQLSDEIIAQVKLPFAPGAPAQNVSNVFYTSFVIQ